jgi:hypothetical protein
MLQGGEDALRDEDAIKALRCRLEQIQSSELHLAVIILTHLTTHSGDEISEEALLINCLQYTIIN